MPIDVTCPGCLARFKVSDQHAGKGGLCPKCKHEIKVPSLKEQVVIHAPADVSGPKDASGRPVLKPIAWSEMKVPPVAWGVAGGVAVVVFAIALILRGSELSTQFAFLATGALLLGPTLAWIGYVFFRNDEFAGFEGTALLLRSAICGVIYAGLWGAYWLIVVQFLPPPEPADKKPPTTAAAPGTPAPGTPAAKPPAVTEFRPLDAGPAGMRTKKPPETLFRVDLALLVPLLVLGGAFTAFATLDLDPGAGLLHYALYLSTTLLLRVTLGLTLL